MNIKGGGKQRIDIKRKEKCNKTKRKRIQPIR